MSSGTHSHRRSHRFERSADFESTVASTNRVAELILNSAAGRSSAT